jgi:glycosyltransferase involved in cell wall biosynthesis
MILWFDVDDLVAYFTAHHRPTGIQRLSFEVYRALWRLSGSDIGFCRRSTGGAGFCRIDFPIFEAELLAAMELPRVLPAAPPVAPPRYSRLGAYCRRLPRHLRLPIGVIYRAARQIAAALRDLAGAFFHQPEAMREDQFDVEADEIVFSAGDWLVSLGSAWSRLYDSRAIENLRGRQVRFAVMVYDIIPELFPEWTLRGTIADFGFFLRGTVAGADMIFTISRNSAADIRRFLQSVDAPAVPVAVLPVGCAPPLATAPASAKAAPFVLLVSTIEVRKNHALMFRVWQRLLKSMPRVEVPELVFAGTIGWLTADFLQQLENSQWLGGKIRLVEAPSDKELAALYKNCLFTVFPSFYEGWGLPVTESLSFGKTVAASNRASIPEAGGEFCVYYDPENIEDATAVIRGLIEQPDRVAALERRIAREFRPPDWSDTAAALLAALAPVENEVTAQAA